MNKQEADIINILASKSFVTQRELSKESGHSLGVVNNSLKALSAEGYLNDDMSLTHKAKEELKEKSPKNAVILAAGFGMRMVPINSEQPKGLLEVYGEPIIERIIKQLHEAGVNEIYVVVGFMKEKYEYLIDEYGVKLIVNRDYAGKNNIHSMKLALKYISNTYIVPSDIWCANNPFNEHELYSWYMVSDKLDEESTVKVNRKKELILVDEDEPGNAMVGISYVAGEDAKLLCNNIEEMCKDSHYDNVFWEEALNQKDKMMIGAKMVDSKEVVEINTYEQLRELDNKSVQLKSEVIRLAADALGVDEDSITDIVALKKGMTNRSFLFGCKDKKYIMRIPGEGTEQLINRREEAAVYNTIADKHICDNIIYINPNNGYKITEYVEDARVCDALNQSDLEKCMSVLRNFHNMKLTVDHEFDIFGLIDFYENLWEGQESVYRDYKETKKNVISLKSFIESYDIEKVLTHIDAIPDNFLMLENELDEKIYLIDWEYAGMQDPHVDIAMFCIYAMYDEEQIDNLIDTYFEGKCEESIRLKIYAYIAMCGLLWSNWCEYKRILGVEFGEYSLYQYRYAKDYYRKVKKALEN